MYRPTRDHSAATITILIPGHDISMVATGTSMVVASAGAMVLASAGTSMVVGASVVIMSGGIGPPPT